MTAAELVEGVKGLISLPEVCIKVNQMIDDPDCSVADIGNVIAGDTDLSARLLRTVNSAFYGLPAQVETISRAITIVGTRDLSNLAISTAACDLFQDIPSDLINMDAFWRFSVGAGVIARTLASFCNILHPERLFIMGVLHDIGRLVILKHLPSQAKEIMLMAQGQGQLLVSAEQEILGFDHQMVGIELGRYWRLPESITTVIGFHHRLHQCEEYQLETALIQLGNNLSYALVWAEDIDQVLTSIEPVTWEITGLEAEVCHHALDDVTEQITALYNIFVGK